MIRIPGRIPITIHPIFWIVAALIGFLSTTSFIGTLVWMAVIFISVLIHEFGHATTALLCKQHPRIDLVAMGGATSYEGKNLSYPKQFLVVLMGPLFGLGLFFIAWGLLSSGWIHNAYLMQILALFQIINLYWTIINLLPVMPLDGGQLVRIALEGFFGVKGYKASIVVGMLVSVAAAIYFMIVGFFLIGVLFFLFAFQSIELWRRSRHMAAPDRNQQVASQFEKAQTALERGDTQTAQELFEKIRSETKQGMLFVAATHYLSLIKLNCGEKQEAYQLLLSVKKHLEKEALCLLQKLAFEQENYLLVAELSSSCYEVMPTQEIALINAKAFAFLEKARPAGGWLRKAIEGGGIDLNKVLNEESFAKIKEDPGFKKFIS